MSELIAEARVLIRPDTTKFRTELIAGVNTAAASAASAIKPIAVPVAVAPVVTGTGATQAATAAQQELATATAASTTALQAQNAAIATNAAARRESQLVARGGVILASQEERLLAENAAALVAGGEAARKAAEAEKTLNQERRASAAAAAAQQRNIGQLSRGITSATLSFVGLRGATLAAGGAFLAGAAGVIAFSKAIGSAAALETSLNTFQATAGATADQMQRIEEVSRRLGQDLTLPGVTAQTAADALSELSKAGLTVQASLGGVRGVLQLSTAAGISTADSVNLVANALNAFSLQGRQASQVADLLAASSKESQGSILDVGLALQQSSAAAAEAGVSIQDTIALLTELQRAGIRGSDAGTSLRTALLRLINPTEKAKAILDGLNVTLRDQQGNIRPEVFGELTEQLNKFGTAQRQAALATIFGADAFRAASIFGREGNRGLNETRDATQKVGVAQELAAARTKGLAGSLENLKNQLQTLGTSLGQAASGPAQDFLNFLSEGVQNINSFADFLGRLGQETPTASKSIGQLADEFARLNKEAGGTGSAAAATRRVEDLGRPAAVAVLKYAALTKELGKLSFALQSLKDQGNSLDTPGARKLAADIEALKQELVDTEPAGLKAASGIEAFRSQLTPAAIELERLKHAISPPQGFLPATPTLVAQGPTPVGPTAKLSAREQVAQAKGDLQEVLRLQQIQLANARKEQAAAEAVANASKASLDRRTKAVQAVGAAEAAVIQTQQQIDQKNAAAATQAQQAAKEKQAAFEAAFLGRQADARQRQQNRISAAEQTQGVADDVREQQRNIGLINNQIAAIKASKLSEDSKKAAILALNTAKIATTGALTALAATQRQQNQATKAALEDINAQIQQQVVGLTASDRDDEKFFRAQIARFKRQAQQLGAATVAGKQATSKALGFVEQLKQLLLARAEAKKTQDKGQQQQGLSVADILRENAQTFKQNAGNLVTGNQPFAGPTGFTADVAQFLTRSGTPTITVQSKADPAAAKIDASINRLIDALTANTAAQSGGTDIAPGTNGKLSKAAVRAMAQRGEAMAKFYNSRQARALEMADTD